MLFTGLRKVVLLQDVPIDMAAATSNTRFASSTNSAGGDTVSVYVATTSTSPGTSAPWMNSSSRKVTTFSLVNSVNST